VKKGQTRIDGMDDKIIGLYAAGLAHSKLGCEISPILLESKENERWPIQS